MAIKPFRHYFFIVLYCHIIVMVIGGLSVNFKKDIIPEEKIITIDLVPIKDITNIKTVRTETDKSVLNQDAKSVNKSVPVVKEKIEKSEDKKEEEKKLVPKENIKKTPEKIDKKISKTKIDDKNKSKTKENKKTDEKVIDKSKSKINQNMKTIEKSSTGDNQNSKKQNREKTEENKNEALGKENTESELSINERQLIHDRIDENWDRGFLLGMQGMENIEVKVKISLSYDGSLSNNPIIEAYSCPSISSNICDAVIRSVITAIMKSSPIMGLPIERYEIWKEFSLVFSPK
jgi:hypothetical protein